VDTHADTHVAAALDPRGGLLGVKEFPATAAGYAGLLSWLGGFGTVALAGIEGTGSYGAGLARHVAATGIRVVEAVRADRQDRRRNGKSDPLDAVSAARAAQSGRAAGAPRGRDGAVEAIRALTGDGRSARNERTQAIGQAGSLILTGPDDLRARFARHSAAALAEAIAAEGLHATPVWPNQVAVEGDTVATSTVETAPAGDRTAYVILGIDVDVRALEAVARRWVDPNGVLAAFLNALDRWSAVYAARGPAVVRSAIRFLPRGSSARALEGQHAC